MSEIQALITEAIDLAKRIGQPSLIATVQQLECTGTERVSNDVVPLAARAREVSLSASFTWDSSSASLRKCLQALAPFANSSPDSTFAVSYDKAVNRYLRTSEQALYFDSITSPPHAA